MLPRKLMFKRSNSQGYQAARQESGSEESDGEEETFLDVDNGDPPEDSAEELDEGDAIPSAISVEMTSVHPAPQSEELGSSDQALPTPLQDVTEGTPLDEPPGPEEIPMQTLSGSSAQPVEVASEQTKMDEDDLPPSYESVQRDKDAAEARDALQEDIPPSPKDVSPPLELSVMVVGDEATPSRGSAASEEIDGERPPSREAWLPSEEVDADNALNEDLEANRFTEDTTSPDTHEVTFTQIRRPGLKTALAVLVNTAIALFILLMILSIARLEYFQIGFKMKRVTKYVFFMEEVFEAGRYLIGPSNVFKPYSSVAHSVDFPEVRIYTTDPLRISFHCHFHFFLKKTELGLLEDELDRYYLETIEKASLAAIKNTASMYSVDNYLEMRSQIEKHIHQSLRAELQGTCCLTHDHCHDFSSCHECYANGTTNCYRGYHIEVPFFNLLAVELPQSVLSRKQAVLITALGGEEEVFHQEAAITRITTARMAQDIRNQAALISANASAHAAAIRAKAMAEARAISNVANSRGLTMLYNNLSIVEQDHKASVHWLRALRYHPNLISGVNFEEYMRLMKERGG